MSAEARELVPVSSVLPEAGFDLIAEMKRYQVFLLDQALLRTGGNKAQAAALLGLNRTTLVEMLKRLRDSQPEAPQLLPMALVPLREQTRRIVMDTLTACGGNATRAADALGIGRTTMYRYLQRYLRTSALEGAAAFEGAAEPESPESPEVVEIPEPVTLPGSDPIPPPPSEPTESQPEESQPEETELPDETPIGAPPAPQALKSEPPTGVHCVRIRRSDVARLRAKGWNAVKIAGELGCSRFLVEKVLGEPASLAKCGTRPD
jgi:DNA-binding protein Fis